MKRRPIDRVELDELPQLPPLDGDEAEVSVESDVAPLDVPGADDGLDEDDDDASDGVPIDAMIEREPESGWLDGAEDAHDLDVGDFGGDDPDEDARWTNDEDSPTFDEPLTEREQDQVAIDDDGAEGPDDERIELPESLPLGGDDDDDALDDESLAHALTASGAGYTTEAIALRAFALPAAPTPRHVVLHTAGAVLAAVARRGRVVLAGEGMFTASGAEPSDGRLRSTRPLDSSPSALLVALVALGARVFVAASNDGRIWRSEDDGVSWQDFPGFVSPDGGAAGVELCSQGVAATARLWARARGGGLFRSEDAGRRWDGPVLGHAVTALAADASSVIVGSAAWPPVVLRAGEDAAFRPLACRTVAPLVAAACRGEIIALAFARGPGAVSADGGRTFVPWPLLEGANAVALAETDDGAVQVLAGVHDETDERAALVEALIDRDGAARRARLVADVASLLGKAVAGAEGEPRIESIVLLDASGRRLAMVTPRGVALVARDPA